MCAKIKSANHEHGDQQLDTECGSYLTIARSWNTLILTISSVKTSAADYPGYHWRECLVQLPSGH